MPSNAYAKALSFAEYCRKHPNERFWQALLNWSGESYILTADTPDGENLKDTFHRED